MFKFFKKKKKEVCTNEEIIDDVKTEEILEEETSLIDPEIESENLPDGITTEQKDSDKKVAEDDEWDGFRELSILTGEKREDLIDQALFLQLKKMFSVMGKVIVRYSIEDAKLEKILKNSLTFGTDGLIISPVYIPSVSKIVRRRGLQKLPIYTIIDFPFGESLFKSKIADIKNSVALGVDGIIVMMPVALTTLEKQKTLKKQLSKFSYMCNGKVTVGLNASDVATEDFIRTLKFIEKRKISGVTLVFGEQSIEQAKEIVSLAKKTVKKLKIKVLANVTNVESVLEINDVGASAIYSPYADEIELGLIERFKIKSVKVE